MSLSFLALMVAGAILFVIAYRLHGPAAGYLALLGLGAVVLGVVWSLISGDEGGPILLAGGVGLAWLHRWARRDRRRQAMARFASDNGFDFKPKYSEVLADDFRLFGRGDGRAARNALEGLWQGVCVKTVDYEYYETRSVWGFYRVKRWRRFSAAILDLGASVPSVIAERNGAAGLASDYMGFHDVQLKSDEFNRRFHLTSDDREFAYKFVNARMLRWLLGQQDLLDAEVLGRRALVALPLLDPEEIGKLLDAAVGFQSHIPAIVRRSHHMPESVQP